MLDKQSNALSTHINNNVSWEVSSILSMNRLSLDGDNVANAYFLYR